VKFASKYFHFEPPKPEVGYTGGEAVLHSYDPSKSLQSSAKPPKSYVGFDKLDLSVFDNLEDALIGVADPPEAK